MIRTLILTALFFGGLWFAFNVSYDALKLLFLIVYVIAWSGAVALAQR
jgi:hypothetical protein